MLAAYAIKYICIIRRDYDETTIVNLNNYNAELDEYGKRSSSDDVDLIGLFWCI